MLYYPQVKLPLCLVKVYFSYDKPVKITLSPDLPSLRSPPNSDDLKTRLTPTSSNFLLDSRYRGSVGSVLEMKGHESKVEVDERLPCRLFATERYPSSRLNVYSKSDILTFIQDVLRRSPEFDHVRNSCFGKLFDIPVRRALISGKLVHTLLIRQLLNKQKYELWTVFGGQPMRFSLTRFEKVTGLPCGGFKEDYHPNIVFQNEPLAADGYWRELIGNVKKTTCAYIAYMLRTDPNMDSGRKVHLAMILIVECVLIARTQMIKDFCKVHINSSMLVIVA